MTPQRRIAVIGAGISGLTTAYRLQDHGCDVEVFEAAGRPGGRVGSIRQDGYLLEKGPHTILQRNRATRDLIDDLDLRDQVVVANEEANRRYVVRDGLPRPIPMSVGDFLETDLLSRQAKLRLLAEPFVRPRNDDIDETLASFVRRRFGKELLDYAVAPFVGGIYAGSPERLSARHGFRKLWELEQTGGSVTGGAIIKRIVLDRIFGPDESGEDVGRTLLSFKGGARQLIDRLSDAIDGRLHTDAPVETLERIPGAGVWRIDGDGAADAERAPFDDIVWTGPTYELSDVSIDGRHVGETTPGAALDQVDYPPVSVVAMGLRQGQVDHPLDGFGVLVPEVEPFNILGCLFISTLFPGRAPDGRVLLSTFVGGARRPALAEAPDDRIISVVRQDLAELLGVTGEPEMTDIIRWPRAIPQYDVGYGRIFAAAQTLEDRHPGLHLGGNFRDGISVPELIDTATHRAEALATRPPRLHTPQRRTG